MNILRIALRNLARQKKRTILLGGAIAFGVMIITLISSFTSGITNTASENFTDIFGGQLYITGRELTTNGKQVSVIRDREVIDKALEYIVEPIVERTFRSRAVGEVIFGSRSSTISIEGVDWADEPKLINSLTAVSGTIRADMPDGTIVLPEAVADDIGVAVGESILVRLSTVTGQQNVAEFTVEALIESGSMFSSNSAYTERTFLNPIIGLSAEQYQVLNLALQDPTAADVATDRIMTYLRSVNRAEPESEEEDGVAGMRSRMMNMASLMGGGSFFSSKVEEADRWDGTRFDILNINDMMEAVTRMVSVLNTVSYVIFIILVVITMVGLLNTFRMVLIERTQEIGTMRAIGMQQNEVQNIFLLEALILALLGALAGVCIALILSGVLSVIPISTNSPLEFFLSNGTFAFPIAPATILSTIVIVSIGTLGAALLPARKAARLDPAVALRTTY
jgi:putative ABC transport system permease protein